jgi:3-dehydroquinate dehydratase/shikimate dehydrogenase
MIRGMKEATDGADLVELRVDALESVSADDLMHLRDEATMPQILTCRHPSEGGFFRGSEPERLGILRSSMEMGFEYVDVELSSFDEGFEFGESGSKLIVSQHAFERFPHDLTSLIERGIGAGADIIKLAAQVHSLADALRLAEAGESARREGVGFSPIALGPSGVSARILASRLQSELVYASARGYPATGPGQLGLEALLSKYRFSSIGPHSAIYGILGHPVLESLSPTIHNAFLSKKGLDAVYVPFDETDIEQFVDAAKVMGLSGFSVTRPFKEAILPFVQEIDPPAREIGAVNTVMVRDDKWVGFNTDIQGVISPITKRINIDGKLAVVVGSGGAARAASYGLTHRGAKLVILGRSLDRAAELAREVGAKVGRLDEITRFDWDILVNATPVGGGVDHDKTPVRLDRVKPGAVVLDMVYDPEWTRLLVAAKSHGARVISGLEMLIVQAMHQAERWTGEEPTFDELEKAARAEIERRKAK